MAEGHRKRLSVVIPVYNERGTWREVVDRVVAVSIENLDKEIVLVDDGSTDGTREQLEKFSAEAAGGACPSGRRCAFNVIFHEQNRGKGAALRTGLGAAAGDIAIVQDADLEYDPADYPRLVRPILDGEADVVFGSRFASKEGRRGSLKNYFANRLLTLLSNLTTGLRLTDMETCYKVFRRDVLEQVRIEEDRFGFEPEITAKVARLGVRVREVPISYQARTRAGGKKIGWKDGVRAVWCIVKYGVFRRAAGRTGGAEQRRQT